MTTYLVQYKAEAKTPNRLITCDRLKVEGNYAFFVLNAESSDNRPGKLLLLVNISNIIDISIYQPPTASLELPQT